MPIKGLSDRRRMPRLGKIKLGILVQKGDKTYPRAVDYFVCPPEVEKVHGEKPKALAIMFPLDDPARIFPQAYSMYRTSGLYCRGDGETAMRWNEQGELIQRPCPCEYLEEQPGGKAPLCKPLATLSFFLPDVPGVGVWQINTSNQRSIVSLNSALESYAKMFGGLAGIPFTLRLEPEQIQRHVEGKGMVKQTLQVLQLASTHTLREIVEWRSRVGPVGALMMPEPDVAKDARERDAEAGAGHDEPPSDEKQQIATDLWTIFMDACGGDTTKATSLSVKAVQQHLGKVVKGLDALSLDETRKLAGLIRPEPST